MNFLFLLLNILIVCSNSYKTYNLFRTKLTTKSKIVESLTDPEFFRFYLEHINAKNIVWSPSLEKNLILTYPQKISYRSKPNLKMYPTSFPMVDFHHCWERENDFFYGNVSCKYLNTELLVRPVQYDSYHCGLLMHSKIIYKKNRFIPNSCLDEMIMDFGICFQMFVSS